MYFTFRMMWCRYWCRLNCIRSHQQTLLPLCRMFEELLQVHRACDNPIRLAISSHAISSHAISLGPRAESLLPPAQVGR
jgi:hypothetical protein